MMTQWADGVAIDLFSAKQISSGKTRCTCLPHERFHLGKDLEFLENCPIQLARYWLLTNEKSVTAFNSEMSTIFSHPDELFIPIGDR